MAVDLGQLLDDLRAEQADLDALVAGADLSAPTPAAGWTVADTLGHLWFFDREGTTALAAPDLFTARVQALLADPAAFMGDAEREAAALGTELPAVWATTRAELLAALGAADPASKVPWYGPPMSPASFATARLMEYWAHGQDVADALGVSRPPTARLRHVCHLGVRTRGFAYAVRGLSAPDGEVYVDLAAPDGSRWTWGDPSSADTVRGDAVEFCLVVAQRRHADETSLVATGSASEWLRIAQIFAGPPTTTDESRRGLPLP